jgi:hypothetical protein
MSKPNKANKSNYDQAGRLTPDELAREYKKQTQISSHAKGKERVSAEAPKPADEPDDSRSRTEFEE